LGIARLVAIVAFALASCSVACATAAASAAASVPLGGVNISGPGPGGDVGSSEAEIATARELHAKVVRIELAWSELEPAQAGQIDPHALASLDRFMSDAAANGLGVIMVVDRTPCWASSAPAGVLRKCTPGRSSPANAWPPRDPARYASFVAYLARRYGAGLAAIEIWNEPDQANQLYFAGPQKAERYARILRAAYPAIKLANPHVTVLGGSIVGPNGAFLRELYADGIKGYYDGLAVHFYTLTLASLRATHEVQVANGDPTPLWLDEFGWSSCYPKRRIQEEQACVTASQQGSNLADIVHSLARTTYVAAAVVYELRNSGSEEFGLVNESGARKPAFRMLSRALASPFAGAAPVTLALSRRGGGVLARGSGPVGDFMRLEAFQGRVLRYRAGFVLDRFDRYAINLPRVLGTRGLRVRVYQLWTGPGRAVQRTI
jgi:hypothetical protein